MPDRFQDVFSSPLPELEAIRNRHPLPSLGHWFCKRRGMLGQRAFFHILASYSICNVASIVVTGGKSILGVHAIVHLYAAADSLALYAGLSTQSRKRRSSWLTAAFTRSTKNRDSTLLTFLNAPGGQKNCPLRSKRRIVLPGGLGQFCFLSPERPVESHCRFGERQGSYD